MSRPAYARRLTEAGILDDAEIRRIKDAAVERVEAAVDFAKSSPEPTPETALENVFA